MSKIFYILLIALFSISISKKSLKSKTGCMNLGDDCDLTSFCCKKWVCKDYRCAVKGTKENQVKWAPKGPKCDWFHHCSKYYICESHRCQINTNKLTKNVEKTLTKNVIAAS